ncbi:MAG: hypothetical protein A3J70_12165 [Elusimicrobia bacterium RIFCSPHIGHO2_02_FULL_61_10]|nr:MAG: hypothetical protein A3I76_08395 [Elusimicrobia bacterium RIFCSPLOWO2_02_FULL_61_11]OGS07015.1 MAG: hypothetical protein A3J70_12165 [Elusimicrobia bacterium RIFCSPHIGHO2_02_FULL_61_10]
MENNAQQQVKTDDVLNKQVVYDGEGYTREVVEKMLTSYQTKNTADLRKFEDLSKAYERLSREMSEEIGDQKSVFNYLGNIFTFKDVGTNLKGLGYKLPILKELIPARDMKELLNEKVEVAQRKVQEVGNYLDVMQTDIKNLQDDMKRLSAKMVTAAKNEETAAGYVLALEEHRKKLDAELKALPDQKSVQARELEAKIGDVSRLIYEHGAQLRFFSTAEDRISAIITMNNHFLEIMTSLHGNMNTLYTTGNEMLNELHGNMAGLASISKAGELTIEMNRSMESLKKSVNKLARLASETSLYLTQNVTKLTAEMKIYDTETEKLVSDNLAAERSIKEQRIGETIELAKKEYAKTAGGPKAG